MKIRATKAQRQRMRGLTAETINAQRAAIEALAAELDRRRQKEPPFEWDDSVLAELAAMPMPVLDFEPVDLSGLFEDVNLDGLLDQPPGTPGPPVYISIGDD